MLKQSPSRNQRTKGFKVKHGFQIFLLIAVGIWLLYQLKHSLDKKKVYEESSAKIFEKLGIGHETIKLGRKGFQPWGKTKDDLIDDAEDSKLEKMKRRRAGANGEIIGNDQDRAEEEETEEVEDLIDEEDKEREEENEEEESEDMGKQIEDIGLLEDQDQNAEASEKHYKENGASRAVMQETHSRRKMLQQQKKTLNLKEVIVPRIDSSPKVIDVETIEHGSFPNVLLAEEIGDVLDLADSQAGSKSDLLPKMEMIGQHG